MLIVRIELHSARTGIVTELGRMYLTNDDTHADRTRGNYDVVVNRKGDTRQPSPSRHLGKATRRGRVTNFPRKTYNVWRLISRALLSAFPEEQQL